MGVNSGVLSFFQVNQYDTIRGDLTYIQSRPKRSLVSFTQCHCVTCQVNMLVNESSDTESDGDDDSDNDNDASSAASKSDSNDNLSVRSDEGTGTSNKLQSTTDRLSDAQSPNALTVTPIKIKCHPKRIRTMDRILHLQHRRRRGRPPLTQNVSFERHSFQSLSRTLSPAATSTVAKIRRMRGRPKGSKNKVKAWPWVGTKQSNKNKQNSFPLATDSLEVSNFPSTGWPEVEDSDRNESLEDDRNSKKSKQTFWRPPTDADSRRVLDQISITDVTANALTVTIRESATQDGFFR